MERIKQLFREEPFFKGEPEDYLDQNLFSNSELQMNYAQYLLIQGEEKKLFERISSTTKIDVYENTVDHYLAAMGKPYIHTEKSNLFGQFPQDIQKLVNFHKRYWNDLTPQISKEDWLLCMLMPKEVTPSALNVLDEWIVLSDLAPFEIHVHKDQRRRNVGGCLRGKKPFYEGDLVGLHLGRFYLSKFVHSTNDSISPLLAKLFPEKPNIDWDYSYLGMSAEGDTPGLLSCMNDGFPNVNIHLISGLWGIPSIAAGFCIDRIEEGEEMTCYYGPRSWMRFSTANLNFEKGISWLEAFLEGDYKVQARDIQRISYCISTPGFLIEFLKKSKKGMHKFMHLLSKGIHPNLSCILDEWILWDIKIIKILSSMKEEAKCSFLNELRRKLAYAFAMPPKESVVKTLSEIL